MKGASLVDPRAFVLATRDTGYRDVAAAVSELVDNSIQAGATTVDVVVRGAAEVDVEELAVLDDGCGMSATTLTMALQFGGTERFNDRKGLGRFGMGLPNASLSQCRRVEVYSWRHASEPLHTFLDLDAVVAGARVLPVPQTASLPTWLRRSSRSGTLILWRHCDRILASSLKVRADLARELGRMFRHHIWAGVALRINGSVVTPIDPLFLRPPDGLAAALPYGTELTYRVKTSPRAAAGTVSVRFSELSVAHMHDLAGTAKRALGIAGGRGMSIVRGGREICQGWFFMGSKRRENYDDWWRCELSFEPTLDEHFGVTHSKQEIHPSPYAIELLSPDIEATARVLNRRARAAHAELRTPSIAAVRSMAREPQVPLRRIAPPADRASVEASHVPSTIRRPKYILSVTSLESDSFCLSTVSGDRVAVRINSNHPFYRDIYQPIMGGSGPQRMALESLLYALARVEVDAEVGRQRYWFRRFRSSWSAVMATFLGH